MPPSTCQLTITAAESRDAGGCNACVDHVAARGTVPHRVWVVEMRGASLRVCDNCCDALAVCLRAVVATNQPSPPAVVAGRAAGEGVGDG